MEKKNFQIELYKSCFECKTQTMMEVQHLKTRLNFFIEFIIECPNCGGSIHITEEEEEYITNEYIKQIVINSI